MRQVDNLVGFNGMSTRLGLFYAERLGIHVHCTFTFISLTQLYADH